ncbi:MAG: N-acetylneuraminate synthase family protein [Candidatus Thermoplasmatota archaeon]
MFRDLNTENPFITAEIGINHNGSVDIAKKLIDMAASLGCDAVKFQTRTLEKVIPKEMWHIKKDTPWGVLDYIDYKRKIELQHEDYYTIDAYCKEKNIEWFSSAWDLDSQLFLNEFDLKYNKLASPMLSYKPLVEEIAKQGKLTFISTGGHTFREIDPVIALFEKKKTPYVVMHCVNLYPCPDEKLNLRNITLLYDHYKNNEYFEGVGYSGHETGILPSVLAVSLGAVAVERHITLDRSMFGSDQAASLERHGLELLVRDTRLVRHIMGKADKDHLDPDEKKNIAKLQYWVKNA